MAWWFVLGLGSKPWGQHSQPRRENLGLSSSALNSRHLAGASQMSSEGPNEVAAVLDATCQTPGCGQAMFLDRVFVPRPPGSPTWREQIPMEQTWCKSRDHP